jgi:hypothetical protein
LLIEHRRRSYNVGSLVNSEGYGGKQSRTNLRGTPDRCIKRLRKASHFNPEDGISTASEALASNHYTTRHINPGASTKIFIHANWLDRN